MSAELNALDTLATTPRAQAPMPRPKRSRNSTRDREKAETIALRRLVQELEQHLAALQCPQQLSRRQLRAMSSTWKRVAERQKMAKVASQCQNRTLIAEVQRNADWIQRLWELLRETRTLQRAATNVQHSRWTQTLVLEQLKTEARVASLKTVCEFAASGISIAGLVPSPSGGGQPDEDRWSDSVDTKNRSSRIVCVRRLPFDVHATSTAVWSALTETGNSSAPNSYAADTACAPTICVALERTHDECSMKYSQPLSIDGQTTQLCAHGVAQALAGGEYHGSKLFVWRSRGAVPLCGGNGIPTNVFCSDDIWIAVTTSSYQASTVAIIAQSKVESGLDALQVSCSSTLVQEGLPAALGSCVSALVQTAENLLMDGRGVGQHVRSGTDFDLVTI